MTCKSTARRLLPVVAAGALALASTTVASAETVTVTDIAGRTVTLEKDPRKVVLGEGRMIYTLALLDRGDPFQRVVGWKDDMIKFDPDAYRKYLAAFPSASSLPNFGSPYSGEWNLEAVIALGTELVVMNLGNLLRARESGIIQRLEAAGVATVFVDFRQDPTSNTVPSIQLLGRILDKRDEADAFTDFCQRQMKACSGASLMRKDEACRAGLAESQGRRPPPRPGQ